MKKLILCKVKFIVKGYVTADLIAAVDPSIQDPKRTLIKELYGNYTVDNNLPFTEAELNDAVYSSAFSELGTLVTDQELLKDVDDYSFILLHRTEKWKTK